MASAIVVLKHETSTLRLSHNNVFQSIWHLAWVITSRSPALINLVIRIRWAVETPRGATYTGMWLFLVFLVFILFFNRATAHTPEPIFAHNSSKDAVWCKEDPFGDEKCVILKFWCFALKTPLQSEWVITSSQNKMSNNSETVRDTRNMSMNHDYETGVALSDSVNKTCVKTPLVEKSRWHHIRLAVKPRYLGNHASQIKSYNGTLSGNHGRSFRIRHEKLPEVPPSGKITMTSYPACTKIVISETMHPR